MVGEGVVEVVVHGVVGHCCAVAGLVLKLVLSLVLNLVLLLELKLPR